MSIEGNKSIDQLLEQLSLRSSKLEENIQRNNMTESTRAFIFENLKIIKPFDGSREDLMFFLNTLEALITEIAKLPPNERSIFFNYILQLTRGPALETIRRHQPTDWKSFRECLILEFGEHLSPETLIIRLEYIKRKGSVQNLFSEISSLLIRIRDIVKMRITSDIEAKFLNNEAEKIAIKVFKRELPINLTALLNANLIKNLNEAFVLLSKEEVFEDSYKARVNNFYANRKYEQQNRFYVPSHAKMVGNELRKVAVPHRQTQNYPQFNRPYLQNYNSFTGNPNLSQYRPAQPFKRQREYDSNQSRIRQYGAPQPMQIDGENFHVLASDPSYHLSDSQ